MRKAAAAMVAAFMTGGATMAVLNTVLGPSQRWGQCWEWWA